MSSLVSYDCSQGIALITINNPPINALSQEVRQGLLSSIQVFAGDQTAKIAVIVGSGRLFIGGAEVSEYGKPPMAPRLSALINQIESCSKPVVSAIHGTALGGGLEIAMGSHYRIAHEHSMLGLPEVKLGLLPEGGGTQRLPRLIGMDMAIEMITSGQLISATEALQAGLIDRITVDSNVCGAGVAFATELLNTDLGGVQNLGDNKASISLSTRRTGERVVPPIGERAMEQWHTRLIQSARGEVAPLTALEAIEVSAQMSLQAGLLEERRLFLALMQTPQRAGLIHAFFAERHVGKLDDIHGVAAKDIRHIGVVGGSAMGAGIATSALLSGIFVTLIEQSNESIEKARFTIERSLAAAVKHGKLTAEQQVILLRDQLTIVTSYSSLVDADLIIEALFESMDVKKSVFQVLGKVAKPGAIMATNTSYLNVDEIARASGRPESVIGLHFFSPAHVMKLLEVVVGKKTPPELVATAFILARKMGKIAVRAGVCDGFIGNRLLNHYRMAANHMVLDGASPYQIDKVLTEYGFAMGPYAVTDLAGLDASHADRQRRAPDRHPRERYPSWADELFHMGRLGQKTGRGYYLYPQGCRKGVEDPELDVIVKNARYEAGIKPRKFTDNEIVRRYLCAMINEAARVLEEGIAQRPLDIDVVLLHGYGFPRWRGGPLHTADRMGLGNVLVDIENFAREDDYFWQPAPLLQKLVEQGRDFNSLNDI